MKRMTGWIARLSAALTGAILAVLLPVAAWAQATPGVKEAVDVGGVLAKYRPSRGGGNIGFIGGGVLCCLIVVAGIVVLIIFLVRRNSN